MFFRMSEIWEFGSFRLEAGERRLFFRGGLIPLRPKVFDTLCVLVARHGRLVAKDELMRLVWPDTVVEEGNLALNVAVLRKALREADPAAKWIETVTGKGYRFLGSVKTGQILPAQPVSGVMQTEPAAGVTLLERERELQALRDAFRLALSGHRQFVCVTGEAGIGKSALLDRFLGEASAHQEGVLAARGQCVEHSGEGEAYMPVIEALGRLFRSSKGQEAAGLFGRYAPTWLALLPFAGDSATVASTREETLGLTSTRMLREFAGAVEAVSERVPVILAFEDLHWADPSTLELIAALARRPEPARLLLAATGRGRDGGESGWTMDALAEELRLRGRCRVLRPEGLSRAAVGSLLRPRATDPDLCSHLAAEIHERTSGNPLFVQALIDYWLVQGAGKTLPKGIPESLTAMIQRKIESLRREERQVLECASIVGASFSPGLVASVLGQSEEEVEERLWRLAARGGWVRQCKGGGWEANGAGSCFEFGHSLYQEVLYEQIPPARKARLHRQAGELMEAILGPGVGERAAELAHHFMAGRDHERALAYIEAAAKVALRRSAHREAAAHLRRGLQVVRALPETDGNRARELALLELFAPTVMSIEGFSAPEAEASFQRAWELGESLGDLERAGRILIGRAVMHELRGEYATTEMLLGTCWKPPEPDQNSSLALHADSLMTCSLFHQGKFSLALERAERGIRIYDPARDRELLAPYGQNPSVECQAWAALCLWFLGSPKQAEARMSQAVSFSETPGHRYSRSIAMLYSTQLFQLLRDRRKTVEWAAETLRLAEEQGYPFNIAYSKVVLGWGYAMAGDGGHGLDCIKEGLATAASIGAKLDLPYLLALDAEAQIECGRWEEARDTIAGALSLVREARAFFYEAELYRLRAAAALHSGGRPTRGEPEADLRRALEVCRRQGSRSLELRAATDLALLLAKRGQPQDARRLLEPLYGSFTEGFETPDLKRAGQVLDQIK